MRRSLICCTTIFLACCLTSGPLWARVCEPSSFKLNNIHFLEVARAVSDMTGQPIELDKAMLKVKVSFLLDSPSSCLEVTSRFEQLVFERGWTMRLTSRKIRVIGEKNNGKLQPIRRMYSLPSGVALHLANRARSMLSPAAIVQVPDTRRILVIADETDQIIFDELLDDTKPSLTLILSPLLELTRE